MAAIPVITFLHDLVSAVNGPYHRLVGRHTQRFCSRAAKNAANDQQKRSLLIAAAGADDITARLLGVSGLQRKRSLAKHAVEKKVTVPQVTAVMRMYMSAVLVLLGNGKERLLRQTELNEAEWMDLWCRVFEYQPADRQLFNEIFVPAYQRHGLDGLAIAAGKTISDTVSPASEAVGELDMTVLKNALSHDAAAILSIRE